MGQVHRGIHSSLFILVATALLLALSACRAADGPDVPDLETGEVDLTELRDTIRMDGSSTVFPISEAFAEEFQIASRGNVRVLVGVSGTGGGFSRFCAGEIDISGASRPIVAREIETCGARDIQFLELPVAYDGMAVTVHPGNDFVDYLTVAELKTMWEPQAQRVVTRWNQVRDGWPDAPLRLYAPGTDSGTFEYFTEAIMGQAGASRGDFTASEDDNVLVLGIANDPSAVGYFGYAYYHENQEMLKIVPIAADEDAEPVVPTPETIADGSYQPLSRPIFIYVNLEAAERPAVLEFLRFYLDPRNAGILIPLVGYVPLPEEAYRLAWQRVEAREAGSVFGGEGLHGPVDIETLFRQPNAPGGGS